MRIGILTLHAQANYGALLQAYALQSVLGSMGHLVTIIDRWMAENNGELLGVLASRHIFPWVKFVLRSLLGFGDFSHLIRCRRTMKFIKLNLTLSDYGFFDWKDAPTELGVDVLVVGSDQVWSVGFRDGMTPYLLTDNLSIPAISYAASFGASAIPGCRVDVYKKGLARFRFISVREQEGVAIVKGLGYNAEHVVDPVLLADRNIWDRFLKPRIGKGKKLLVCYLMHDFAGTILGPLIEFARVMNARVDIFLGGIYTRRPQSVKELFSLSTGFVRAAMAGGIHLRTMATPDEFVSSIAHADWVVTDSFHGLMFSTVFKKNVRVLRHADGRGAASFARLSEFVKEYLSGDVIFESEDAALRSLIKDSEVVFNTKRIDKARTDSLRWLKFALLSILKC